MTRVFPSPLTRLTSVGALRYTESTYPENVTESLRNEKNNSKVSRHLLREELESETNKETKKSRRQISAENEWRMGQKGVDPVNYFPTCPPLLE
jgi:hypothetical protein